jgi:hypothetical protein
MVHLKKETDMKFLITFDGTLLVGFEPHEVEEQIEFIMSINPTNEEDSEILNKILLQVIENDKGRRKLS